jgi:glycosyltransferase involved in cell wall biosynthesis
VHDAADRLGPIRVLWLVKGLGPGGAEALLVSAGRVIDHERFDVEVAYVRPDKDHLVGRLDDEGVPCHLLGGGSQGALRWPMRLRALLAAGRFDIVHVHSPLLAGAARLEARTLPRARRPAVVTTEHNEWDSFSLPTRLLNSATSSLDDHRWAVSAQVRDSMRAAAARESEVLVHGIPLDDFIPSQQARTALRAQLAIPDEAFVACTIANFREQKDYPTLLRAYRQVVDGRDDFHALIVGQGPLADDVRRWHAELGLAGRVHILGYRTDTADLLAASDVFVLGSTHEGYPVALMEAFAAGKPVVATAVGGVRDALESGEAGVLVPARDPEALAKAILRVAADPVARARMADASLRASAQFDIRRAVERQCEVYEELAARRRARLASG